ncbi:MAG: DNRLRE domain-containing protein [Candidatus Thorarchaeota archaeon]
MKKRIKFLGLSALILISLLNFNGFVRASSIVLYPIDDSFVDSSEPDRNRGNYRFLNSGQWMGEDREMQAFIAFNFSSVSSEWTKVKLSLTYWLTIKTVDVDIVRIMEEWDEDTITWNNMPNHGTKILTMTVEASTETTKILDLSSHLEADFYYNREVFSICIYMPVNQGVIVGAISKEYVEYPSEKWPQLIFSSQSLQISSFPLWVLLISMILSMTGLVVYFKQKKCLHY